MIGADVITQKRRDFLRRSRAVKAAQFSPLMQRTYTLEAVRSGQVPDNLAAWIDAGRQNLPGSNSVYTLTSDTAATATALRVTLRAVRALPEAQRGFSTVKDNTHVPEGGTSLYVGGSLTGSLSTRLCQHLDRATSRSTYALNMGRWPLADLQGSITVTICTILGPRDDTLANDIEDALWQSRQPIFGRLGR